MNTLKIIEQKIKFRNCIINFKKYLDNLDDSNRHYIINDINQWINLYKNNNKSNNTNVNNFYNHISNNSNLTLKSNDIHKDQYWNTLFSYIEIKECREFIRFLKNISNDDIEDEEEILDNISIGTLGTNISVHTNDIPYTNLDNQSTNSSNINEPLLSSVSINS